MANVSVAMAVYNGSEFLNEQIGSIVNQLSDNDELIISDNCSTDDSRDIILSYSKLYPNIKFCECNEMGIIPNFENAILHCTGNYILLADQDDVWKENKVERVLEEFKDTDADLILHDCEYVDENLNSLNKTLFKTMQPTERFKKHLWKNIYQGCCLAFKREMVSIICPIPRDILIHDQWIGLLAEKSGEISFLKECLILHRKHKGSNSTRRDPLFKRYKNVRLLRKRIEERLDQSMKIEQ